MDFDSRFFLASAVLSLVTGVSYRSYMWLHYLNIIEFPIPWLWLAIEPPKLFLGVFLTFAVMYSLATREKPEIAPSLFVTVFLGCWIGQLVALAMDTYFVYSNGISDLFYFTSVTLWEILISLFSVTLFVSLTAIFLANYREQQRERAYPGQEEAHA